MLADRRTLKGGGSAGVATLGTASDEISQSVLTEAQSAILPLAPLLDALRCVFIALAFMGIAVAVHA